jgi:hypothetical protein
MLARGKARNAGSTALFGVAILCGVLAPATAGAATITVDTTADDGGPGDCELREAVAAANTNAPQSTCPAGSGPSDTIVVPAGEYAVALTISVATEMIIDGAGSESTTITRASGVGRIIDVGASGNLDLRDAEVSGTTVAADGAGISNAGTLTLRDAVVANNHAFAESGGGIHATGTADSTSVLSSVIGSPDGGITPGNIGGQDGGGIFVENGNLTVRNSLIADNQANNAGATANGGGGGGIEIASGFSFTVLIEDTTFRDNDAQRGGGLRVSQAGTSSVTATSFEGNSALVAGGAALQGSGTLNFVNSTFSGNDSPGNGGAIFVNAGTGTIANSTLAGNDSPLGATIRQTGGTLNLRASLLEGAAGQAECSLPGGTFNSLGYNVAQDTSCGLGGTADQQPVSPGLLALADNGGPTLTHALSGTSAALNTTPCDGLTEDQRGVPRPFGSNCDGGAYERMTSCAGLVSKDLIRGTAAAQTLAGSADSEVILGLGGNDTINAGGGNDDVCAGTGNDAVNGGAGNDRLAGEQGTDTASFSGGSAVKADLASGKASGQGSDTLASLENLTGTAFGDRLLGNGFRNVIRALGGKDRLIGRGGRDKLVGGGGRDLLSGGKGRGDACLGGGGRDRRRARGCERRRSIP